MWGLEPGSNSQCIRVNGNISFFMDVFENELKELQEICLGLLKHPEEYSQRESFKVFRKGSREVSKTLNKIFIMNNWKAALSYKTSVNFSSSLFILLNIVF